MRSNNAQDFDDVVRELITHVGDQCVQNGQLNPNLRFHASKDFQVYAAPMQTTKALVAALKKARVLFVGITPGRQQAVAAFAASERPECTDTVSFSGQMRASLNSMLDALDLPDLLAIEASAQLFDDAQCLHLACSTSMLRFPVFFADGKPFSGRSIERDPVLKALINLLTVPVLKAVPRTTAIVPMGVWVEKELQQLSARLPHLKEQCLFGFPHPSPLNGHRQATFARNKRSLKTQLRRLMA